MGHDEWISIGSRLAASLVIDFERHAIGAFVEDRERMEESGINDELHNFLVSHYI